MTAIVDYGVGNLRSVQKACEALDIAVCVTGERGLLLRADRVILPGVGAFAPAMERLVHTGLDEVIRSLFERKTPLLGICLGMQLFFEESEENGRHRGFGFLPGRVTRFPAGSLKVPQMGWNAVEHHNSALFRGLEHSFYAYFVHSYHVADTTPDFVAGVTEYGRPFCSSVECETLFGTQFHPEKSGDVGLSILKRFSQV